MGLLRLSITLCLVFLKRSVYKSRKRMSLVNHEDVRCTLSHGLPEGKDHSQSFFLSPVFSTNPGSCEVFNKWVQNILVFFF